MLGCGLAVLSLVAIWLRVTLLDTDRYVSTVAPLAAEPPVQRAVATKLKGAIYAQGRLRRADPRRRCPTAPTCSRRRSSAGCSRSSTAGSTEFTQSARFQQLWTEANRRAHTRVIELLEGGRSKRLLLQGNTVYLDLSSRDRPRARRAAGARADRIADAIPPTVDGQVALFSSDALAKAQRGVRLLKALAIVLPILAAVAAWPARSP